MTVSDIINLCLTIVTIIISMVALWQTNKQAKLSNKQQLFDRRLDQFHFIKELLSLYEQECKFLNDKHIVESVESNFIFLTNNSRLESMASIMHNPLGQEEKRNFLTKCEQLEKLAIETTLIWNNDFVIDLNEFIKLYVRLLKSLHKQQIAIKNMPKTNLGLEEYTKKLNDCAEKNQLFNNVMLK